MGESFLKDAIDRIVEMAAPKTYQIGPYTYASRDLELVDTAPSRPKDFCVDTLSGLVRIIKEEGARLDVKLLVQVEDQRHVAVWSDYLGDRVERARKYDRWRLYTAEADVPRIRPDQHRAAGPKAAASGGCGCLDQGQAGFPEGSRKAGTAAIC